MNVYLRCGVHTDYENQEKFVGFCFCVGVPAANDSRTCVSSTK